MSRANLIVKVRQKLRNGDFSIGSWIQIPHGSVAEILSSCGYDWIAVDMEHGAISHHQLPDLMRAIELGGVLPLARIAEGSEKDCKHALDAGAGGLIVPMVETAEFLSKIVEASCWPPNGSRGVGFSRANLFGKYFVDYSAYEGQSPLIVGMVESVKAVENFDEIARVDGLDAIFVGPYDLSASLGCPGDFSASVFIDCLSELVIRSNEKNIPIGIHVVKPDQEELEARVNEGFRFIAYGIDAVNLYLMSACPPVNIRYG